ncbi:hypothetical protein CACET_c23040 [Clostridium aceticum]|uniref:Uncharacterized protein n=1 Tax=Clostridium aceticum TaxID=84022 RepID=A0A0D8I9G4_9CLOT|nr:DUF4179 domain-containing protein [Clostridium aceticum]AKL95750.1 hypothetical protein CACET_c23040 [Clostridium aceticum]KJF26704.1 hypothetical protein TZ02_10745 [Clostridium aceticum]
MTDKLREKIVKEDFIMPDNTSKKLDDFVNKLPDKKVFYLKKFMTVASLLLVFTIVSIAGAYANGYRLQDIYHLFGFYHSDKDLSKYVVINNTSVQSEGITVTINESILDENNLILNMTVKNDTAFEKSDSYNDLAVGVIEGFVDDTLVFSSGSGYGEFIDQHTYNLSIQHMINTKNLPTKFGLKYVIKTINDINGNWTFHLDLNKEFINSASKIVDLNEIIDFQKGKVVINKVAFTPISTRISLLGSADLPAPKFPDDPLRDGFIVYNQDGQEIPFIGIDYNIDSNGNYVASIECDPVNTTPSSLTLIPYKRIFSGSDKEISAKVNLNKLPIILTRDSGTTISINKIEHSEEGSLISFIFDLVSPDNAPIFVIYDETGSIIEPKSSIANRKIGSRIEATLLYPKFLEDKEYVIILEDSYIFEIYENEKIVLPIE